MRWIIATSLRLRLLILPLAAALVILGFVQLRSAPVDVLPEFTPPTVQIQTEALGLSAAEVEQLITVPLEADFLAGLPWVDDMTSESVPGLSSVDIVFEQGTDILRARQMVQERLSQAFVLPNVSTPPFMIQPVSSTNRVLMVGLSSQNLSEIEMSVLTRWIVKPRLMGVPGVANVAVWGHRERQLQVQVDPARLKQAQTTLNQIITTTGNALWVSPLTFVEASTPGTGGFVESPNQRLGIQHVSPITKAADLAEVTIEDQKGDRKLRLGDVAQVVEDHQPLIGDALVDNGPGLMMVVEKFPGASTTEVTEGVEEALESLRPGLKGVEINTNVYRPATFIDQALRHLGIAFAIGALLLIAVLLITLGAGLLDWRATVVALAALLVTLALTGIGLHAAGIGYTTMTLGGLILAAAFVIADAVGDVHTIARRLRTRTGEDRDADVLAASTDARSPMIYATLIAVLAAAPALLLPATAGAFLRPLALSFLIAVVASAIVALLLTPALSSLLLRQTADGQRRSPFARWSRDRYATLLARVINRPVAAFAVTGVILLAGLLVAVLAPLGRTMIPPLKDRTLLVEWQAAAGTSTAEMIRMTERAGTEMRAINGVSDVGAHVGRAIAADRVVGANSAELWATVAPGADYAATVARIHDVAAAYPGVRTTVQTYPQDRIDEVVNDTGSDLVVRIYGEDYTVLRDKAAEVERLLATVPGLADAHAAVVPEEPTVQVRVDLAKAQKYGLKPGDVRRASAALISGVQAGSLFQEQKVFEVVVWGAPGVRSSLTGIRDLLIDTPGGGQVRLGDVADVTIAASPSVIHHDAVSRYADVSARITGGALSTITKDVNDQLAKVTFPVEYHAELVGDYAQKRSDAYRTIIVTLAALLGIFLLLQAVTGSWLLAAALTGAMLVAVGGGLVAGLITGVGAISSLAAAVAIAALTARFGIEVARRIREHGDGRAAVAAGARAAATPILITAAATAALLLPVLFLGGPGGEVARPLVMVLLGGLIVAVLVTLLLLPVVHLLIDRERHARAAA